MLKRAGIRKGARVVVANLRLCQYICIPPQRTVGSRYPQSLEPRIEVGATFLRGQPERCFSCPSNLIAWTFQTSANTSASLSGGANGSFNGLPRKHASQCLLPLHSAVYVLQAVLPRLCTKECTSRVSKDTYRQTAQQALASLQLVRYLWLETGTSA